MNKRLLYTVLPLLLFIVIATFLWLGLFMNPHHLPSSLINKKAPHFELIDLTNNKLHFNQDDLKGHVSLVDVWASWCLACRKDHYVFMDLARELHIPIYGIDYKDDRNAALSMLSELGNPFTKVGFDEYGDVAIDWGVYGAPELFILDKHGFVRFKRVGAINHALWKTELLPVINKLKAEA